MLENQSTQPQVPYKAESVKAKLHVNLELHMLRKRQATEVSNQAIYFIFTIMFDPLSSRVI